MRSYDTMKDSGYPWMGEIPAHWRDINPKALFTQRKERAKEGERQLTASQQYGVLYQDEYMALTGSRVVVVQKDFDILKHVEAGDFVISMRSFQGGLEYSPVSGSISSAYVMLIPNKELVYPPFYKWLLKSSAYIRALQSTTDLVRDGQAMRYSNFAKVRLLVAPIEEQRAIAAYLDDRCSQIDAYIEEAKSTLDNYKLWRASIIHEAVTRGIDAESTPLRNSGISWIGDIPSEWAVRKIKNGFSIYSGATPKSDKPEYWDGDIVWITPADYKTENKYVGAGRKNLSKEGYASCGTTIVPEGSVIFSKRAPVGTVAINSVPLCTNQGCLSCVPNSSADSEFFYYAMSAFTEQFELYSSGTTFKEISASVFANFSLPFPPLKTQKKIAAYLTEKCARIDAIRNEKLKLIQDLEDYKRSIINESVTGKRKVV